MAVTRGKRHAVFVFVVLVMTAMAAGQRQYGGITTAARLANYQKNAATSGSAAMAKRDEAVQKASPWLRISDDDLWHMVPAQSLPRCIDVTWDYDFPDRPRLGCLQCGDDIYEYGAYPYTPDFSGKPWKLTCPNCGVVFPTNDFGAYYNSGIDEHGIFDPKKADHSLLFNADHPDPADPLHTYGVDDGYGFVKKEDDGTGRLVDRQYKFIAYYAWKYWRYLQAGAQVLADAYVYTGDKRYAHKAAILLDRIADVYPDMDWKPYADMGWYHSDGSSHKGKIEGRIWETQGIQWMVLAYEKIISGTVDDPVLYRFLARKARQYKLPGQKGTRAALIANIDRGLVETAAEAIMSGRIYGNEGMHQYSLTCCALALDTEPKTSQWLDWNFTAKGGHLPKMLVEMFDRDGMADEGAPGYCYLWPSKIVSIMDLLEPYTRYDRHRISRDFPWFKNALRAPWRVQALQTFTPNIGDSGAAGSIQLGVNPAMIAAGFEYFQDEEAARFAYEANGMKADGLLLDNGLEDPAAMNKALEQAALDYSGAPRRGENLAGFGLATIEFGSDSSGKALWMYYGRNYNHGHADRLNYSLYAFGTDLMPDLGYPEFANLTWVKRANWNNNTISHNTVIVDGKAQRKNWVGFPHFFASVPGFGAAEVESREVYPQTKQYMRTMAMVQAPGSSDAYVVDFFRVTGGKDHLMSFHGPAGSVAAHGLTLTRQTTGTYAGPQFGFGDTSKGHPVGYSYLENVERQSDPPADFWLDWKAQPGYRGVTAADDLHLRLHVAGTTMTDVALADGIPPQNKPGNPKSIRYALLHRAADANLKSIYTSVAEPWKGQPFIGKVSRLKLTEGSSDQAAALKVELLDGAVDYIISNPEGRPVRAADGPATDGVFAWLRMKNGKVTSATVTSGEKLEMGSFSTAGSGKISGRLLSFEKDLKKPATARIHVTHGDGSGMVGSQIVFSNDRKRNACYDIQEAHKVNDLVWDITCAPGSFVRGFLDASDYAKGYDYNVAEGQEFTIPQTAVFSAD